MEFDVFLKKKKKELSIKLNSMPSELVTAAKNILYFLRYIKDLKKKMRFLICEYKYYIYFLIFSYILYIRNIIWPDIHFPVTEIV